VLLPTIFLNVLSQETKNVKVAWAVVFRSNPIVLNESTYLLGHGSAIVFKTLKFYISNIQLMQNGVTVFVEPSSFHLVDVSDTTTQIIYLRPISSIGFDRIQFSLGVDSTTSVSGAMSGDLDPTKGMYWAWQSGYINFKMEGICATCSAPNNEIEYHLGGYQDPFNALQVIELATTDNSSIEIDLDLNELFNRVDMTQQQHIMSPCANAVALSKQIARSFSIR